MVCLVGYGLSGGFSVGCGAGCMGLHSVGCSGWYTDAVAYLSGLCSGFESCVGLWVCSVSVDGVCSGTASQSTCSNKAHTHTVAIDGFTSLPIIITQQDASHPPLKMWVVT
jgi:hypothetical protein